MRQLVLDAFSSISPEYCQKVCNNVKHLEEVTIQAEMAMHPIVEQMITKVGYSSDEDSDVELEEAPPLITNIKSNEDQIIQKIIVEQDKLYPRRKSQQYTGCACKGYCNSKKFRCVADNEKYDDCICPPDRCSNRDTQLPGPSSDIGGKRRCKGESAFLYPAYPCKKFFFTRKQYISSSFSEYMSLASLISYSV